MIASHLEEVFDCVVLCMVWMGVVYYVRGLYYNLLLIIMEIFPL